MNYLFAMGVNISTEGLMELLLILLCVIIIFYLMPLIALLTSFFYTLVDNKISLSVLDKIALFISNFYCVFVIIFISIYKRTQEINETMIEIFYALPIVISSLAIILTLFTMIKRFKGIGRSS